MKNLWQHAQQLLSVNSPPKSDPVVWEIPYLVCKMSSCFSMLEPHFHEYMSLASATAHWSQISDPSPAVALTTCVVRETHSRVKITCQAWYFLQFSQNSFIFLKNAALDLDDRSYCCVFRFFSFLKLHPHLSGLRRTEICIYLHEFSVSHVLQVSLSLSYLMNLRFIRISYLQQLRGR